MELFNIVLIDATIIKINTVVTVHTECCITMKYSMDAYLCIPVHFVFQFKFEFVAHFHVDSITLLWKCFKSDNSNLHQHKYSILTKDCMKFTVLTVLPLYNGKNPLFLTPFTVVCIGHKYFDMIVNSWGKSMFLIVKVFEYKTNAK